MRVIHLARKPLSEPSVAANVLKHGCGALNIDACRVGPGRWPSNLMLQHLEGCQCVGTTEVRGTGPRKAGGLRGSNQVFAQDAYSQAYERTPHEGFSDASGMEQVALWECVPGCPVPGFDGQEEAGVGPARFFLQVTS